jgi:hypothetical protein
MGRCLSGTVLLLLLSSPVRGQEPPPSGGQVQQNLHRILSSGEYETGRPGEDPMGSFWEWLFGKIDRVFRGLSALGQASPAVFWLILVVCLGLLVAIFAHGGVILVRSLRAARVGGAVEEADGSRQENGATLLDRAQEEARRGRFTEAIRCCHRAALLGLDRRGLVRFHESLTSGDYRRQLERRPREKRAFEALARVYEPAFFGGIPAGEPDYSESLRLARVLAEETAS